MINLVPQQNFLQLLEIVKDNGGLKSQDFVAIVTPVLNELKTIHENKKVLNLQSTNQLAFDDGHLIFTSEPVDFKFAHQPLFVKPQEHVALDFTTSVKAKTDLEYSSVEYESTLIEEDGNPNQATYLLNYNSWEQKVGHCDPLTDIFSMGMYLASLAYGLDFSQKVDLQRFVENRKRLYFLNKDLHPTIHNVIFEMTQLYREDRLRSAEEAFVKLKNYREYNPENYVDLTQTEGFRTQDLSDRSNWILSRLKSRLFDISRRNKMLYFTDRNNFLNLSVSSVPLLLDHNNIKEEDIIFWNDDLKKKVVSSKKILLNKYLDIKNNRFIAPTLNQIRLEARKNKNEYGFSTMRLIVAFLHWYNFKDNQDEMITSPLLWLPAEIVKKKGVNEQFELIVEDAEAVVNPVLSYYLKDLYDITLPDFVDLNTTSIEELIKGIEQQIAQGGSGITLEWRQKPRIQLIHSIAKKNFNLRNKTLHNRKRGLHINSFNYSYDSSNFKPLGLQIFENRIKPKNNALEYIINEDLTPDQSNAVSEKARTFYTTNEDGDVNPTIWQIDTCNITLGNLNYRKMSLVRDYNQIINENIKDEVFEMLFSELPKKTEVPKIDVNNLVSNFPIISADPTQASAVELARTGESYIIQGPPGTGKSQTITNLIADYVARDKKILFVCEKRAALDVVYHRLKNKKLDELCCLVHDSQSDKKAFIMDLKETYEDFLKNDFDATKIEKERNAIIDTIDEELRKLTYFHQTMSSGDVTPLELYEILHSTKGERNFPSNFEMIYFPTYKEWRDNQDWVSEWMDVLRLNRMRPIISDYPFVQLDNTILRDNNPKAKIQDLIKASIPLLDEFSESIDELDHDTSDWKFTDWKERFDLAISIKEVFEKGKLNIFDPTSKDSQQLLEVESQVIQLEKKQTEFAEKTKNWKSKLPEQDVEAAISKWQGYQKSIFRFLTPGFYKFKSLIKENYNFSAHSVAPEIEVLLNNLLEEYQLQKEINTLKDSITEKFGLTDFSQGLEWVKKNQLNCPKVLENWINNNQNDLIKMLLKLSANFNHLYDYLQLLFGKKIELTLIQLEDKLTQSSEALTSFSAFSLFLEKLQNCSESLQNCIANNKWEYTDFEFNIAYKSLTDIYEKERQFAEMGEDTLRLSINKINKLFDSYYESNVLSIRSAIRLKFNKIIKVTESTASQLSREGKQLKKEYLSGRRILENEFGKSMRYKSIRDLSSSEANPIMTALKPVWLMSPLSVSDTMPIDVSLFDVVIFDEASQITVEEGVPSLFRTKQTIIVGDEMQMPPTNFFNTINLQDDEDEEQEEKIGITLDADSLLNQGARKLSSVMLGWHYRSRRESLISFSNAAFYKRGLLTIPDSQIHDQEMSELHPIVDVEAKVDIDQILNRSISYHYIENGVYENRINKDEATYIANIVRELLKSNSKKSIGIVAFSMGQQSEIENALSRLAADDPAFDLLLEEEYQRMDEDQYNGLFVKNLENVQGDERDIIIMSVCYGYNEKGKMLMNFGPINRRGGEKRLNVIFSRAKMHMVVVTSIQPTEIKNDYNEGANYFKKFLTYSQHISNGRLTEANGILDSLHLHTDATRLNDEKVIVNQLKLALEAKGFLVDLQIGQSFFKCDLGIKEKDAEQYKLGVLIDHESHYNNTNVLEQYCQRPQVLNAFGWKVYTVYSKDWLEYPERVLERIEQLLNGIEVETKLEELPETKNSSLEEDSYREDNNEETEVISEEKFSSDESGEEEKKIKKELQFDRFEFVSGSSNKYWQIVVHDTNLIVQYGRIGNNPQENVKTFETKEKAEEEKNKMIQKKVAKGYQKV